jgi:O-antigen/teichoic acid export membrane protein
MSEVPSQLPNEPRSGEEAASSPPGRMGRHVGSGAAWMMAATILVKIATFASQIVLGKLLTDKEFGLYAAAVATAKLLSICQDAGVRDLLVQRGSQEYPRLSGPIFWFAGAFNLSVGALIAALAWPIAHYWFQEPRLVPMLLVLAMAMPLGTPSAILQAKLRLDLRFAATSWVMIVNGLIRQISTVCLALAAVGEMSFVYPVLICALVDSVLSWWLTRDRPWTRSPMISSWLELFRQSKWLIFGSVANLLIDRGPYLVMQPTLVFLGTSVGKATSITGAYFWAFEITAQLGVLLSFNMQQVLMPVLARLKDNTERLRRASLRAMAGLMMIGSAMSLGMAVTMDPLEKLIFGGKWEHATGAVAIFGLFFPFRILYGLTTAAQVATGRFRQWCFYSFIEGLAFTASGAVAAYIASEGVFGPRFGVDATSLAWITGGTLALVRVLVTIRVMKEIGISRRETFVELFWPWLLAVLSAGVAWSVDDSLGIEGQVVRQWALVDGVPRMVELAVRDGEGIAGLVVSQVKWLFAEPSVQAAVIELIRLSAIGFTMGVTFVVSARMLMPDVLREACGVAPRRLGLPAARLLRLEEPTRE